MEIYFKNLLKKKGGWMNEILFQIMFLSIMLSLTFICLEQVRLIYRHKACKMEFNSKTNSISLTKWRKSP